MKPNESADAAAAPARPSAVESLKAIEVASLDRLIAIAQERARIAAYRTKADENKKEVSEAVYARVSKDYAERAAALDAQSTPLRTQARAEYRKLKALIESLAACQGRAQLEKDELQFRHTVGELSDGELAAKLADPQKVLDQCALDRKELEASRLRFVEALGSEQALEAPEPSPPPAPAAPWSQHTAPDVKPAAGDLDETRVARPMPDLDDQETRMVVSGDTTLPRTAVTVPASAPAAAKPAAAAPAQPAGPAPADDASDGATVVLATAAVVIEGSGGKEYPLTVLNGIGRAEDNRICLSNAGLSRKHAVITAASGGFMIKDLGSQNGTFVNGQKIAEKKLVEGDAIEVGSVKLVFRTPWPPRGGAAARPEPAAQAKS